MRSLLAFSEAKPKEEKLVLRIKADNEWDVYIPVGWYSQDGTQSCAYSWNISIDWLDLVKYEWTWSTTAIRVWYWLTPLSIHTVRITPAFEEYWWLRAFWYKGSNVASSLINIISDKSYKWFALSALYTWDYYKAYQYYGCTNLVNTDDELLPDTLEIIWNNYRAYEYYGCTKLKNNAEEKILKTVKVIWNNYRAHQYEWCTSMVKIWMRAINRAAIWSWYRDNMLTGIAWIKNKANITIEWWIVEWWNWWLSDDTISTIKVYEWLVEDYQTKLSTITETKISAYHLWDTNNYEFIEYIAYADSTWKIRIPIGWYSTSWAQDCAYDWMISIDWWEATEYSWTWSASYISIWSWLTEGSEHRIVIEPKTVSYWWGRAFWFYNTWAQTYIKELIHDSYKCYGSSMTSTGNYYKYRTYYWCTNLINSYEKLPTSVTAIWDYYMQECNYWCTWLTSAFWEVLHWSATVWTNYRYKQYAWCTSLATHQWMAWYTGTTYPTLYKDSMFDGAWNNMNIYISRLEKMYTKDVASSDYYWWWTVTLATITTPGKYVFSWNLRWTSSNTWFDVMLYQNNTQLGNWSAPDPWTMALRVEMNCNVWDVIQLRPWTQQRYWNINTMKLEYGNVLELSDNNVSWIYVYVDDLYNYTNSNNWWSITSTKFKVYYFDYQPVATPDITKYTTLVWTWNVWDSYNTNDYWYDFWLYDTYHRWVAPYNAFNSWWVRTPWARRIQYDWRIIGSIYTSKWKWVTDSHVEDAWRSYDISTGGSQYYDWNVINFYVDYKWNILYANWRTNSRSEPYRELWWRATQSINQSWWDWVTSVCASRDWRYIFWNWYKYYSWTKWWGISSEAWTYSWTYSWMDFSDDWLTVYLQTNQWTITQYNLNAPWDLTTLSSTWKSLSISWSFAFSKDFKYLYVYNWTLKVYEYNG